MRDLAIVGCSQLVTLAGPARPRVGLEMRDLGIISNGAMLVRDGKIALVGTRDEVLSSDCEVLDVEDRVVLPGFVDAHTHPVFGGNRVDEYEMRALGATYQEIAAAGGGIKSTVAKTRAATEEQLFEAGKRYANWFLKNGTTTIEAKSGYGLCLESELKLLRTIRRLDAETALSYVPTFLGAHAVPSEFADDKDGYARLVLEEMLPVVINEGLAEFCDIFCEGGYFDVPSTRRILSHMKDAGLDLRIHADQLTLSGGAELAAELGAKTADHLELTDTKGIEAMKAAGVQPVLLPGSVYALGHTKYPDARQMIEAGLAVVLATDFNPGSSPTPSMPMMLSLACTHMKMSPAEAVTAATINAAYSLNRGHDRGSLEPGKRADFIVADCDDYRELAYFFGVNHVSKVFVQGSNVTV